MVYALRVLIVEDSRTDRTHLAAMLRGLDVDYQVIAAASLAEAREAAVDHRLDAILLDLSLPDVAEENLGIDALASDNPDVAIVVVTAEPDPEVAIMAARHGAEDCMTKEDLEAEDLDLRIRAAIARNDRRWRQLQQLADAVALQEERREEHA